MAKITAFEKQKDLKMLEALLNDLEIPAQCYLPGNLFSDTCLICMLPTNYNSKEFPSGDISEEELNGNDIFSFSYLFQIEDEEDALTKQLLTYCALNQSLAELETSVLYRAVNALNLRMSGGYFTLEAKEDQTLQLQYRFILTAPVGKDFSEECFFQLLTEMTLAADTASAMIDAMKQGIDHEVFLKNPFSFSEQFSSDK